MSSGNSDSEIFLIFGNEASRLTGFRLSLWLCFLLLLLLLLLLGFRLLCGGLKSCRCGEKETDLLSGRVIGLGSMKPRSAFRSCTTDCSDDSAQCSKFINICMHACIYVCIYVCKSV